MILAITVGVAIAVFIIAVYLGAVVVARLDKSE